MCACNKNKDGKLTDRQRRLAERWTVVMPNGLEVSKPSEIQARNYAAKHPGATVKKVGG